MIVFAAVIVITLIALGAHAVLAALAIAGGYGAWYAWSITRRPYRPCWWCRGRGWRSGIDPGNDRERKRTPLGRCWVCHGRKTQIRWGVIVFRRKTYASIRAGRRGLSH